MKVLLKQDVENLGDIGEVVTVAKGYARNYLLPRDLAVEANPKNIRYFEHVKKSMTAKIEKARQEKQSLAERLSSVNLAFKVKAGEDGKLFGSVTSMDIQKELSNQGIDIDKKKIIIHDPIKRTGEHDIEVKLHVDIVATIKIEVAPE